MHRIYSTLFLPLIKNGGLEFVVIGPSDAANRAYQIPNSDDIEVANIGPHNTFLSVGTKY